MRRDDASGGRVRSLDINEWRVEVVEAYLQTVAMLRMVDGHVTSRFITSAEHRQFTPPTSTANILIHDFAVTASANARPPTVTIVALTIRALTTGP